MHSLKTIEKLNAESARKEYAKKISLTEKAKILFNHIIFNLFR